VKKTTGYSVPRPDGRKKWEKATMVVHDGTTQTLPDDIDRCHYQVSDTVLAGDNIQSRPSHSEVEKRAKSMRNR
jgi:hypothetical protein